jgi:hypothetical protein
MKKITERLFRIIILCVLVAVLCLMPALLLYYLGYEKGNSFNKNAVKTNCLIINHDINMYTDSYSCNCMTDTKGQQLCSTCYTDYYNGYIDVEYEVDNVEYTKNYQVLINLASRGQVEDDLNDDYPIGSQIDCYYDKNNPSVNKLNKVNTTVFFAFFIIFCIIGGIVCIGGLIICF